MSSSRLSSQQGLSEHDLAFDSIADLFQRDAKGSFVQLEAYLSSFDMVAVSDEELLVYLRRLVYSRVNQALFRMYHEVDPLFSKILRNLKLALQAMKQFDEIDRFGENYLVPVLCDTLEHLPALEPDLIKQHLCSACIGTENIPQMLGRLAFFLRQQESNSRIISMMTVANVFQSVYAIMNRPLLAEPSVETDMITNDTAATIKSVCRSVKREMMAAYVGKNKVSEQNYDTYFEVIEANMIARFVMQDGDDQSYLELLKTRIPDLTPEEYKKQHRAKLEYLGALAHKLAIKKLKSVV
ncbi:MAG: hypothetical protein HY961_13455 [Ignavibacteriae bacterium]|nr:hypothetical protein [Ignavibacteriota bacterium]